MTTTSAKKQWYRVTPVKAPCDKPEGETDELSPERKVARLLVNRHVDAMMRLAGG
ncbi:MAG: hypothetical protein WCP21_05550 [Armatimonadota bacterium]